MKGEFDETMLLFGYCVDRHIFDGPARLLPLLAPLQILGGDDDQMTDDFLSRSLTLATPRTETEWSCS